MDFTLLKGVVMYDRQLRTSYRKKIFCHSFSSVVVVSFCTDFLNFMKEFNFNHLYIIDSCS